MTPEEAEPRPERAPVAVRAYPPVDRAVPSEVVTRDITVPVPGTNQVNFVVRRGLNFPAGPFPAEPGKVPVYVDSRTAVCHSLPWAAAYR